jgi:glutamine amidotransferase
MSETTYGSTTYCTAVKKDNIYGCQFHPENSGETGLKILKAFLGEK